MASSVRAALAKSADARKPHSESELRVPEELPFLASISWFDGDYRALSALEMLSRYEAGWRYLGVLGEPSPPEERFIKAPIDRFGSVLHV